MGRRKGWHINLRARYYDPATGQFISRDPLRQVTRSEYGYIGDAPLNGTDPSGLLAIAVPIGVGAGIATPGVGEALLAVGAIVLGAAIVVVAGYLLWQDVVHPLIDVGLAAAAYAERHWVAPTADHLWNDMAVPTGLTACDTVLDRIHPARSREKADVDWAARKHGIRDRTQDQRTVGATTRGRNWTRKLARTSRTIPVGDN